MKKNLAKCFFFKKNDTFALIVGKRFVACIYLLT